MVPYEYVRRVAKDKIVLDAATGDGYGASHIANVAKEVVGIDIDKEEIKKAQQTYKKENLKFLLNNVLNIDFPDGYFDIVISSQTIEHIELDKLGKYLSEISRVLKKDGTFFVSTLNLIRNLKGRTKEKYDKNPYHVKEFTSNELKKLLLARFSKVEILGLHRGPRHAFYAMLKKNNIFKIAPNKFNPVKRFYENVIDLNDFVYSSHNLNHCFDLMAVCKK